MSKRCVSCNKEVSNQDDDLTVTPRTAASERAYKTGGKNDIAELAPISVVQGLKIVPNEYPYDLLHKQNDMLIDSDEGFAVFWNKLGKLLEMGKFDEYDQVIFNISHRQSQKHIPHAHLLKLKDKRSEISL